jgi:hydroxyacylglutathione hydrolase
MHVLRPTHHRRDHAGGNNEIAKLLPGVPICGGAIDNVEACTM